MQYTFGHTSNAGSLAVGERIRFLGENYPEVG